jgi:superfamily II DNA or RNA helicase
MTRDEIQIKALESTQGKSRAGLALGTGVGKTKVGLMHIEDNYSPLKNILIVVPKRSIIDEWKNQADKFGVSHLLENAIFTTYLSLTKHNPDDYDLLYLDECHSLLESHKEGFLDQYSGKILGLTGTPPRNTYSEKWRLVNEFCPIVYTYVVDDAVEANILNDYKIVVHMLELGRVKNVPVELKNRAPFYTSELEHYTYWTNRLEMSSGKKQTQINAIMRMKGMQTYKSKELYAQILLNSINDKCIVFANTQEQADRICKHSYHSNNSESTENLEKFKSGEITKLSCVLQLSEGVNIPGLKQGIILHAYGNERKSSQRIGRLLRLNPDDKAIIHILCYMDTKDEDWVRSALEDYDQSKIIWKDFNINLY